MCKEERMWDLETWKRKTNREGTQVLVSQTATDGTPPSEEITLMKKSTEKKMNTFKSSWKTHCCEVEMLRGQIQEVKGGAVASEVEVSWASSQARMVQPFECGND